MGAKVVHGMQEPEAEPSLDGGDEELGAAYYTPREVRLHESYRDNGIPYCEVTVNAWRRHGRFVEPNLIHSWNEQGPRAPGGGQMASSSSGRHEDFVANEGAEDSDEGEFVYRLGNGGAYHTLRCGMTRKFLKDKPSKVSRVRKTFAQTETQLKPCRQCNPEG